MTAAILLKSLRATGISISSERGRLIVEAPAGVLSAQLRAELVRRKPEVIAALEVEQQSPENGTQLEVQNEIASLLATAYRRHAAIQRVGTDRGEGSVDCGLANSDVSSVHGDVP